MVIHAQQQMNTSPPKMGSSLSGGALQLWGNLYDIRMEVVGKECVALGSAAYVSVVVESIPVANPEALYACDGVQECAE